MKSYKALATFTSPLASGQPEHVDIDIYDFNDEKAIDADYHYDKDFDLHFLKICDPHIECLLQRLLALYQSVVVPVSKTELVQGEDHE